MVGRALSGWPDINHGGLAPGIFSIVEGDRDRFRALAISIFAGAAAISVEMCTVLLCVVLLHFPEVEQLYPNNLLHNELKRCAMYPGQDKVLQWCKAIKAWHQNRNGIYVPLSAVDEMNSVNVQSFKAQLDQVCQALVDISTTQERLREQMVAMAHNNDQRFSHILTTISMPHRSEPQHGDGVGTVPSEVVAADAFPEDLLSLKKLTIEGTYYR